MTIDVDTSTGTVHLNIAGQYNADQLLVLLKRIAGARNKVARDPHLLATPPWMAPRATCHTALVNHTGPDSVIAFRFPGLGWIGSTMSANMRMQFVKLLLEQQSRALGPDVAGIPPAPRPSPVHRG